MKFSRSSPLALALYLIFGSLLASVAFGLLAVPRPRHVEIDQSILQEEQWKIIDKTGRVVSDSTPNLPSWPGWINTNESGEIRIKIDEKGRELKVGLEPWSFTYPLIEVTSGKLHGFVDKSGELVIQPIYQQVEQFHNGLTEVRKTKASPWEIIDQAGHTVRTIDPKFEPFICGRSEGVSEDGLLLIQKTPGSYNGDGYVLNIRDNQISHMGNVGSLSGFHEGVARFSTGLKHNGFLGADGKQVIPPIYDFVWHFSEGYAPACSNGRYFYIDKSGKEVITLPADCSAAGEFHRGLAAVAFGGDSGNPGYLKVRKNARWGFIDKTGRTVIPAKYYIERYTTSGLTSEVPEFSEGLCKVTISENNKPLTGFIDSTGNWVLQPQYSQATNFKSGVSRVCIGATGFTRPKWIRRKSQRNYSRQDLFCQFLRQFGLIGMTRAQVRQILGLPELVGHGPIMDGLRTSFNADVDIYMLNATFCGNCSQRVLIRYMDGVAAAYCYTEGLDYGGTWITDVNPDSHVP
jgi:WG containing repeat